MSRTDKTDPYRVLLWVDPAGRLPEHDHRVGECDLPQDIRGHLEARTRCTWGSLWDHAWAAVCSCELCHGGRWCRAENRRDRRASRRELHWLATRHRAGLVDLVEGYLGTRSRRR